MNILITGGTGFIGERLCQRLITQGYTLWVLTRQTKKQSQPKLHFIHDLSEINMKEYFFAVINLAGEPIAQRWTQKRKEIIRQSRIELTHALAATLKRLEIPPQLFLSGSAIGFYGSQGENALTENSSYEQSFSHQLCQEWEDAANSMAKEIRVCNLRTGVVLGCHGGMLSRMRLPFLLGLGGPIASGNQWISWIHIDDLISAIIFILANNSLSGPLNATAPNPVTNEMFANTYAQVLHRPSFLRMPSVIIKSMMGQMGEELLIQGQRVIPKKLLDQGFTFHYPTLKMALEAIESPKNRLR